jgi:hypothetical protein
VWFPSPQPTTKGTAMNKIILALILLLSLSMFGIGVAFALNGSVLVGWVDIVIGSWCVFGSVKLAHREWER